jgi:hypothetical protein
MANKRIKISELPKITYNPLASGVDTTVTKSDYMPIAVTDKNNAAVKTTMAITTRELQRFVLNQSKDVEDIDTELTIGRPGLTVKTNSLSGNTLTVAGTAVINYASVSSIEMARISTPNGITAGSSIYPTRLLRDGNIVSYGMLVSNSTGNFTGEGMTLRTLLGITPITSKNNAGSILSVSSAGFINYIPNAASLLGGAGSVTSNSNYFGNIVSVATNGGLDAASGKSVTSVNQAVDDMNKTMSVNRNVVSQGQKFITTTNGAPSLPNLQLHDSGENNDSLTVRNVVDTIKSTQARLQTAQGSNQRFVVSNDNTPTLRTLEMASLDHMKLVTTNSESNNAQPFDNAASTRNDRVVFNSPVVLAAKHQDDIDLTDITTPQGPNGPTNFTAQIGEIRWNVYNNVPTLYLAVGELPTEAGGFGGAGAKIWYGVPLFGTIAESGSTLTAASVTAHSYEDLD